MKTRLRSLLTGLAVFSTISLQLSTAFAQGTAFTYQGRLTDGGTPAHGVYDLVFSLFIASSGGGPITTPVTNSPVAVSNGLFTVMLDFGTNFPGADRWLEIGARTNGADSFTLLNPRQQITAAPYAIRAANVTGPVAASQLTGSISPDNIAAASIDSTMLAAGAVTTAALADGSVTAPKVATVSNSFAVKIANPTPATEDIFGSAVATLGSDRVLIGAARDDTGATDAGAAYLFSANGMLRTTFTNPTPASDDNFGASVAALGTDRVLIGAARDDTGATDAGAAYLFSANGALLTAFTNPVPSNFDNFGSSVAALGNDHVLIGADQDNSRIGVAYLFHSNGTRVTTFFNPTPAVLYFFGTPAVPLGDDHVLIGARGDDTGATDAGAVYLFSTNGTLANTFTNPSPASNKSFGISLAAVGTDRALIGASSAAYLFQSNGIVRTTFTNPAAVPGSSFGIRVAAVGTERVLIAAPSANAVYLFSVDGTLLATLNDPAGSGNFFGSSVAAVGSDRLLIASTFEDAGATDAGAAYLFAFETFAPGLVAEAVRAGSVTASSLADGAVTAQKLDPGIGVWTRVSNDIYRASGNVGIGTTAPGFNLHVNGTAGKPGGGSWAVASDRRLKKNIRPLTGALNKLLALHGVNFEYINPAQIHELPGERSGLIAQEVEKVFPDWIETGADGYKRVTVRGLEALVVEALRELQQQKDGDVSGLNQKFKEELKRRDSENAALKRSVDELKTRVNALARKLDGGAR